MPFKIIRNDITRLKADAVVNAANTALQMGGGVCGAIFKAAGADKLRAACDRYAPINTGEAVVTPGFDLSAKIIIHAAGPIYHGLRGEAELLRSCYLNALELAVRHKCKSIAFPLISSGIYGYPKIEALNVATAAIRDFIGGNDADIDVSLVVFDKESFEISEELLGAVESFINEHYVEKKRGARRELAAEEHHAWFGVRSDVKRGLPSFRVDDDNLLPLYESEKRSLDDLVGNLDEPFSATLLKLIDVSGKKDPEVYNRANIDRRLFSKIRSNARYAPSKPTVLAFAVALELDLTQTKDLLERAGFALSRSRMFDVIVEYFIVNRRYDVYEINEVLFTYDQPLLGGG